MVSASAARATKLMATQLPQPRARWAATQEDVGEDSMARGAAGRPRGERAIWLGGAASWVGSRWPMGQGSSAAC